MQTKPVYWDAYYASPTKTTEYKVMVGAEEYLNENLYPMTVTAALCSDDALSIGNVISRKLELSIAPKATVIPKMANVDVYMRFNGVDGPTVWVPKGKFFIDTRKKGSNRLDLTCYDAVLKMEKPFLEDGPVPDFPMPMTDATAVICTRLGLTLDNPAAISSSLSIEYPNEMTMREVAGHIASANGGNFIITESGKLRLVVPAASASVETVSHKAFDEINDARTFSRITMYYDSENFYTAGNDTGDELIISNPWATQAMCDHVLTLLGGYVHLPFSCAGAYINPVVELGDRVTLGSFVGTVMTSTVQMGASIVWNVGAPGDTALEHEYPYEGTYSRAIANKMSLNSAYYGVNISRQNGLKIEKSDGSSQLLLNSDVLKWQVKVLGNMVDRLYFDAVAGDLKYNGKFGVEAIEALKAEIDVVISNTTITNILSAGNADIAQLTVDRLETSQKVQKYLASDTSDVNYIRIQGKGTEYVTASVSSGTSQQVDRFGNPLYWLDDTKKQATTNVTTWPVTAYNYAEHTKLVIEFYHNGITYVPRLVFGTGSGVGDKGKGIIEKIDGGLMLKYIAYDGSERTITLHEDGIKSIGGQANGGIVNVYPKGSTITNVQHGDLRIVPVTP